MPTITRILSVSEVQDPLLRYRAERGHGGRSQEFVATEQGIEVGLLSYEDWSNRAEGFIYEIFVLPQFRNRGVGGLLLAYAEKHARHLNCALIRLKPHALDEVPNQTQIEAWYERAGYSSDPKHTEFKAKQLPVQSAA